MSDDPRSQLEALADAAAPAPGGLRREHEIRRAVEAGLAAPAGSPRRVWPWVVAPSLAAAAALAIFALRPGEPALVVEHGAIAAPDPGQLVEVPARDRVVLRTPDDSTVEASELTRFARDDRAATRWHLDRGHLASHVTKRAPGQTFEVATPEATVAVVGTRFSVDRAVVDGVAITSVRVDEGIVRVTPTGAAPVLLHAGERWPAPPRTAAIAAVPAPLDPAAAPASLDPAAAPAPDPSTPTPSDPPAAAPPDTTTTATPNGRAPSPPSQPARPPTLARPARPFDATAIRKIIRAGHLADARHLIDAGRKAASAAPDLAELGILAAEAELAGRATRRAIDLYLAVVRDYPTTPQAEQALFAAAQLAADRPDAGYRPAAMLRDYLDTYPHGQFAADARRLVDHLQNK